MGSSRTRNFNATVDQIQTYAIFTLDLDGRITSWNKGAEKIKGWNEQEVLGKYYEFLYRKEDKSRAKRNLQYAAQKGSFEEQGLRIKKNEELFLADISLSQIHDEKSGEHVGYIKVVKDITDQRQKEDVQIHDNKLLKAEVARRKKVEKALIESNRELDAFASAASHDLQEPLRMVVSYLELLQRRYRSKIDSDGQEFMDYAIDGANRMKHLISDLADFARIDKLSKKFKPVSTDRVVKNVLDDLELAARDSKAIVKKDELPVVMGDDVQLRQLFQNLISNSIKFTENTPKIEISSREEKGQHLFCISDNGSGIDPKYHETIFHIFKQVNKRSTSSGSGVGLAICRKIVKKHGGKLWVESKLGEGSIFKFTIPKLMSKEQL